MEAHVKPVAVTDQEFTDKIENAQGLSVVDLWAEWCGPCRAIAPLVDELAAEYEGKVSFYKLDTENNRATPTKYGVMSIPTLLFFRDGKLVDKVIGVVPKKKLQDVIDKHL